MAFGAVAAMRASIAFLEGREGIYVGAAREPPHPLPPPSCPLGKMALGVLKLIRMGRLVPLCGELWRELSFQRLPGAAAIPGADQSYRFGRLRDSPTCLGRDELDCTCPWESAHL